MDLRFIRSIGKKAGIAINPPTPIELLSEILEDVDLVLIMGVNPGFSGQKFTPKVLEKISKLRKVFKGDISVDGGVNGNTAKEIVKAGANILVSASYLYSSKNYKEVVENLKK
jgi:ribulose-phosphate 3-epimerase